jgi:hypothetical protein
MGTVRAVSGGMNGRGDHGRFLPGNPGGKGNPNAQRMYQFRKELLDAGDAETIKAIIQKVGGLAKEGDLAAATLYLGYMAGKPVAALELSGPGGEPLGLEQGETRVALIEALSPFGPEIKFAVLRAIMGPPRRVEADEDGGEGHAEPGDETGA